MGSIERRLERLECRAAEALGNVSARDVLGRMAGWELDAYEAALVRSEAGEAPTEKDRAVAARVEAIREEVGRELAQ